jgi:uncharacterized repeat protein (TIGR03803 family)
MNRKRLRKIISVVTAILLSFAFTARADYQILHHFAGGSSDGANPYGSIICSNSVLYGMTGWGGSNGYGTIFKVDTDGNNYQVMRNFVGGASDGQKPYGSLTLSGSTLYGMAGAENTAYNGVVFKIDTDGSGYQVLHIFAGPPNEGKWPYDSLLLSGSTLYGMTVCGGIYYNGSSIWGGTVFKINNDSTGFQVLHNFAGSPGDGQWSPGNLIQSGSTLYGMTYGGGASGRGTIFKINNNGTGFQLLHSFTGNSNDGADSHGSLIQVGDSLYGITNAGGSSNRGVVFKIDTDGTDFQVLHSFTGNSNDGGGPIAGSLIQSGSILYGMTYSGGASNNGVVFQIDANGTGFQVLHSFNGTEGKHPYGSLLLSGLTLYGMTGDGGSSNQGVIFALDIPVDCVNPPEGDLNGDCKVDFQDFAVLASEWLDCGLEPHSACN